MSNETLYYLGASTVAEPLVNKWVAWSHILPPLPSSQHLQHYQIKILQNYLKDPRVHVKACQDPKLRSGRFVDVPEERAGEIAQLLADTKDSQRDKLQFANSFVEFYTALVREAEGQSLETYYDQLPPNLRGYVELNYDYYHRPMVRLLENLLYESPYYDDRLQSLRLFQEKRDDSRPFFMSTPRLPQEQEIEWTVPFASPKVDEFFELEDTPQPLSYIRKLLGLEVSADARLLPLLSTVRTKPADKWEGAGVRIRYLGHACVLIEWKGVTILTDPCVAVMPVEGGVDRVTYWELPEKIDYVLVTHGHHDHFFIETLLRLRRKIGCLVVPRSYGVLSGDISLKLLGQKLGFKNAVELDTLESIGIPEGAIIAIPFLGEHADLLHGKTAYVVRAGNEQMLFAADSDCLDEGVYENVCRAIGPIQTVFIGMECVGAPLSWSCGAFFPVQPAFHHEQTRRYKGCDAERAHRILEAVGAERTFVYAMGLEPWLEYLLGLALADDSPQIIESGKYLAKAREKGFAEAELLFGRAEIILEHDSAENYAFQAIEPRGVAAGHEDQFVFD